MAAPIRGRFPLKGALMTQFASALPDPTHQAGFYANVATKRLLAWVLDTLLILFLCLLALPFTAFIALFFFPAFYLVIGFAYRTLTLTGQSATLGMRLMAIELRDHHGAHFGLGTALVHTLGYSMSMAFVLPQVISAVLMVASPRGQGLTDLVLGSAAINRP